MDEEKKPSVFPMKKSEAKIGQLRREGKARATTRNRKNRPNSGWTRNRIDYEALEAAKIPIETIVYKVASPGSRGNPYSRDLKVSLMPWSRSGYLDIRFYIRGKSTGQGVLVHLDHMAGVVSAVLAAERQARALGLLNKETQ